MFKVFLEWIQGIISRLSKKPGETDAMLEPAVSSAMQNKITIWAKEYERPELPSLKLPASIASALAMNVTIEFESEITGSKRADYLNEQYQSMLMNLRRNCEYACAKGGLMFKPYPDGDRIVVDAIPADRFFPTAYDASGNISGVYFVQQLTRGKRIFTRFELHEWQNDKHRIRNIAYESKDVFQKGSPIPLDAVPEWAELEPDATFPNARQPLFAYFRIPQANKVDPLSPLGVSVFDQSLDLIHDADSIYRSLLWEIKGGELAVEVDESLLYDTGEDMGKPKLPKGQERLYRTMRFNGIPASDMMRTFSPTLREQSFLRALNKVLQSVEFTAGLAYGTLSDPQNVDKTATEIKASKQMSYTTVRDIQKSLENALDQLIYAMDYWATHEGLAPTGKYEVSYQWDDSIMVDAETERQLMLQEVAAGIRSPESYLREARNKTDDEIAKILPGMEKLTE